MTRRAWAVAGTLVGLVVVIVAALALGRGAVTTADATPAPTVISPRPTSTPLPTPTPTEAPTPTGAPTPTATPIPTPTLLAVPRDANGSARALITGDSLAAGFFATSEDRGFSALLANALGPVELTAVSRAHQTLTTVAGVTDVPPDLDLAVIELGTNDVGIPTPLADFDAQYADLVARIRASSPDAALICTGTWTADGAAYDEVIARVCAASGGRYVSLAGLFATPELRGPDGRDTFVGAGDDFHPNDAGHRAIADAVRAVLAP
ncbi:MAG: SGNH/GDSL hydrolase family protein [Microbacterium enclense]